MKLNFRHGGAFASKKAHKYLETISPNDIKTITVIRHAAIGDFVVMRPFLLELREFFPNAKITLSVLRNAMYGMPEDLVDSIHIMDKYDREDKNKKTGMFFRIKQAKELKEQDIIFDLTDSSLSLLLVFFANAKLKIGYSYRAIRRLFYDISTLRSDFVLETKSMLHQLNILGANTKHYPLEYGLTNKSRNSTNPYIIYFAGASVEHRCWSEDKFIELIKLMAVEYPDYKHVVLKGIGKTEHFNNIYNPYSNIENVIHQDALPIEDIYDYLAQSSLVIVGDTGIRNMAIASNTPTLGIMWIAGISPMRYLPKTKEHQVVITIDGQQTSTDKVYNATKDLLDSLYEK